MKIILLVILSALVIWFVCSNLLTIYEKKKYPAIGELVEVDGKNMHVYKKGEGKNTIVLLSGLGTTAPVLDFEPLVNELAKKNNVVVAEAFGYGWSDITEKERTVENIIEELRAALQAANISGPYVLMPHSISGIYSMYYANTYPEEVKAIIGIDPTLPQALNYFDESAPSMPKYMSYLAPTGVARLATYITPDSLLPIAEEDTYSNINLKTTKAVTAWKGYNKNIVSEANEIKDNINKTKKMTFSADLPVLIFTKEEELNNQGKSNITFYEDQLTNVDHKKIVSLDGHHYLHWTYFKEMSKTVNDFLKIQ
ncbi:alpha/beta hydrolase [Niallia circulans]|uniref:Alpha/beta hydrolase n=2 Tax=Niallia circulans TaxID=1397 RepID=A0A553SUI9_NIACI|nr:alpha/beta hydrolase [Niallia circulans]